MVNYVFRSAVILNHSKASYRMTKVEYINYKKLKNGLLRCKGGEVSSIGPQDCPYTLGNAFHTVHCGGIAVTYVVHIVMRNKELRFLRLFSKTERPSTAAGGKDKCLYGQIAHDPVNIHLGVFKARTKGYLAVRLPGFK